MSATSASCGTAATSCSALRCGDAAPSAPRVDAIVPPVEKTAILGRADIFDLTRSGNGWAGLMHPPTGRPP